MSKNKMRQVEGDKLNVQRSTRKVAREKWHAKEACEAECPYEMFLGNVIVKCHCQMSLSNAIVARHCGMECGMEYGMECGMER